MRQITISVLCLGLLAGCGKDENNDNATTNNATTNNASTNNTATNNTSTNNTATNNTATNNTSTNNATSPYDPFDFTCDALTPTGALDDILGFWDVTGGCIAADPYEPLYQLCPGAVVPRFDITSVSGFTMLTQDYKYVTEIQLDAEIDIYLPESCSAQIGGCDSVLSTLIALAEAAGGAGDGTCEVDPAGGCFCTATGTAYERGAGVISSSGDGMLTLTEFDDGTPTDFEWQMELAGTDLTMQYTASGTRWDATEGTDPGACQRYCAAFLANCNDVDGVTGYDDTEDCLTQCAGFEIGVDPFTGDSLSCRLYHALVSIDTSDPTNQATHCPHAQATATDPCVN